MHPRRQIKRVFIASVNQDGRTTGEERYVELRSKIAHFEVEGELDRWVAEYREPDLPARGWRSIVDTCVREIHRSDLMVVLLYRRLGSPIEVDDLGPSPSTYLEIELFHAALKRLPVVFFQADDFRPDPGLQQMIGLLARITHPSQWVRVSQRKTETEVLNLLNDISKRGELPSGMQGFCDALSDSRSFAKVEKEINSTRLSLLRGFEPAAQGTISLKRLDLLLGDGEQKPQSSEETLVDRLSRLWMALRELAQEPGLPHEPEIARRWVRLCELWTSSAAWLHLHGPLELGVLATLHTRVELRKAGFIEEGAFPYGAFASEAYSIAKTSDRNAWKRRRFDAARRLATKQIEISSSDFSGALGVRASAAMQLVGLGERSLLESALQDYREMLRVREEAGASDSERGEALVELGYAEFIGGQKSESALFKIRRGVLLMEADQPNVRSGFLKRGKLKLINALEVVGATTEAAIERTALKKLVRSAGLPSDDLSPGSNRAIPWA